MSSGHAAFCKLRHMTDGQFACLLREHTVESPATPRGFRLVNRSMLLLAAGLELRQELDAKVVRAGGSCERVRVPAPSDPGRGTGRVNRGYHRSVYIDAYVVPEQLLDPPG
jgi:hypothetical protein